MSAKTIEALAKLLVRRHKLTKFQAQAIYQGKTRGLVVGNYLVLDKIGQGEMGYVYKAQHRRMKRVVVLKVLPSAVAKDYCEKLSAMPQEVSCHRQSAESRGSRGGGEPPSAGREAAPGGDHPPTPGERPCVASCRQG